MIFLRPDKLNKCAIPRPDHPTPNHSTRFIQDEGYLHHPSDDAGSLRLRPRYARLCPQHATASHSLRRKSGILT